MKVLCGMLHMGKRGAQGPPPSAHRASATLQSQSSDYAEVPRWLPTPQALTDQQALQCSGEPKKSGLAGASGVSPKGAQSPHQWEGTRSLLWGHKEPRPG